MNYFDTAEIYGNGVAEIAMGKAFKRLNIPRKDLVVSTKFIKCGNGVNDSMLSRKHLIEGMNASLSRLQLDYVDVAFAHRYDHITPMEETCRAFNWLIEHGKCFYWATSEWNAAQVMEANRCCEKLGLIKPIADQPQYNMLIRKEFEEGLRPLYEKTGYGTTIWSPLANGLLSLLTLEKHITNQHHRGRFSSKTHLPNTQSVPLSPSLPFSPLQTAALHSVFFLQMFCFYPNPSYTDSYIITL